MQTWIEQQHIPRRRTIKQYAQALRSGLWGGALEIMVFTQLHPVDVEVYVLQGKEFYRQMQLTKSAHLPTEKTVRLLHTPDHYDWLEPRENRFLEEAHLLQSISRVEVEDAQLRKEQLPHQPTQVNDSQSNNQQQLPAAATPNECYHAGHTEPNLHSAKKACMNSRQGNKRRQGYSQRTSPKNRISPKVGMKRPRMSYFTGRISRYPLLPEESVAKRMRVRKKLTSDDPVWEVRDSPNINAYEFLGIAVTATTAEVSQAYRRLISKCHPDKNPTAQDMAKHLSQKARDAMEILTSEELRGQYDEFLKAYGRYNGGRGGMAFRDKFRPPVVFRHQFNLPSKQKPRRQPFPPMKSPPLCLPKVWSPTSSQFWGQMFRSRNLNLNLGQAVFLEIRRDHARSMINESYNSGNGNGHRDN